MIVHEPPPGVSAQAARSRSQPGGALHFRRTEMGKRRPGICETPTYRSWSQMRQRCYNPNHHKFPRYGGRGITVCLRWRESFAAFLEDMGERTSTQQSIERINNDGNYSCGQCPECLTNGWIANCRWATAREQARNRSNTRMLSFLGQTMCMTAWAAQIGISPSTLETRLFRGWSVEDALTGRHTEQWKEDS